jgi:glyoxylate reductase
MFFMLGSGIQGKTLGIVGLGQIGTATARRARAFGMRIAYTGRRRVSPELEAELVAEWVGELDELVATADVVSLHCPLTPETHHLIDARRLALMKPGAYLVNTTRGPVVDEAALTAALREGTIAGAGLDVFENEPNVPAELLALDNVVLTPHVGSATWQTRQAMADLSFGNLQAHFAGKPLLSPVP